MKIIFISATAFTIYIMLFKFLRKDDLSHDSCNIYYLLGPCVVLALIFHASWDITEVPSSRGHLTIQLLWTFSIYLEAIAILPQLWMLQRTWREVEKGASMNHLYIFTLGLYRGFYILNWIYRYVTEPKYSQWIAWVSGFIQTILYSDFFYYYVKRYACVVPSTCVSRFGRPAVV
jgi:ER lumen protein retaining receptor